MPRNILPKQEGLQPVALLPNPGDSQPQQLLLLIPPNPGNNNLFVVPPQKPFFRSVKGYIAPDPKKVGEICRTCYRAVFNNNFIKLFDEENEENSKKLRYMLKEVIPKLDLDIYLNPVMCVKCVKQLFESYEFKNKCQDTETKFGNWVKQRKNVQNNDVNLLILVENCTDRDEVNKAAGSQPPSRCDSLKEHDYARKPFKAKRKFSYKVPTGRGLLKPRKGPCLCEHKDLRALQCHFPRSKHHAAKFWSKKFKRKEALKISRKNNRNGIYCNICDVFFHTRITYNLHVAENHKEFLTCEICDKKFKDIQSVKSHYASFHAIKSKISDDYEIDEKAGQTEGGSREIEEDEINFNLSKENALLESIGHLL